MGSDLLTLCYLAGSITFILGLKMLSNPASARKGNLVAATGMLIAVIGTIFLYEQDGEKLHNYPWIFAGLLIGGVVGTLAAPANPQRILACSWPSGVRGAPENMVVDP